MKCLFNWRKSAVMVDVVLAFILVKAGKQGTDAFASWQILVLPITIGRLFPRLEYTLNNF